MALHRIRLGVLCIVTLLCTAHLAYAAKEKCRGAFDVYFVLDKSSSLLKAGGINHFQSETVTFVERLSNMFVSPLLRMSFITFAGAANTIMPLTGNRTIIREKLKVLKSIIPYGRTAMDKGIKQATDQIMGTKDKRASIIIALTDGRLDAPDQAVGQANRARTLGSQMFMVGVSEFDEQQLLKVADGKQNFVFKARDFGNLVAIADQILDTSCVEILSADPNMVCVNDSFDVRIHGRGFNRNGDLSRTMCNFWADGNNILKKPKRGSDTFLVCESPKEFLFQDNKIITVQVSLNKGLTFISSNVTISAYKCTFSASHLWITLIFLLLLLLLGLWWMWNVLTCKSPRKDKPKQVRPPPPPPRPDSSANEPKHWPSVDASFYGGAGAGGIKPVPVRWGDKGSTEAAAHLEKTKDAKEIVIDVKGSDENANSVQVSKNTSTCGILSKLYRWLEKKRPGNDDLKNCSCTRSS